MGCPIVLAPGLPLGDSPKAGKRVEEGDQDGAGSGESRPRVDTAANRSSKPQVKPDLSRPTWDLSESNAAEQGGKPMELFVRAGCEDEGVEYGGGTVNNVEKSTWEPLPQPIIIDSGASTAMANRQRQ